MKNIAYILIIAVLFVACAKNPNDLFVDEIYNEKVYLASRNYQELIRIYKKKLSKQEDDQTRLQLSQYYFDSKDYNSVLYYVEPLVKKQSVQAFILQARAFEELRKFDEALESLQGAMKVNSTLPEIYNLAGIAHAAKKDYPQAKQNFLTAKKLFLSDEIVNTNLGMVAILQKNYKEAVNYLMPLYKMGYKDSKILSNLVLALVKDKQTRIALEIVEKENMSKSPRNFIRNIQRLSFDDEKSKG